MLIHWNPTFLANGFLPTRGSFMLDVVFLAMFLIVAVMLFSIYLVRYLRKIELHRKIQIVLATVLAVAIIAFEIDVRFLTDWRKLAEASPFYENGTVDFWLWFHLLFAIPTPFVWIYVIVMAVRKFQSSPGGVGQFGDYAATHRLWGRIAAVLMIMTAVTGCAFYWIAFVA